MKYIIKQSNNDKKLVIPFGGINNLLGYDDDVQSLVTNETDGSINTTDDLEVKRFNSVISGEFPMNFYFWNGSSYVLEVAPFDFAANSLTSSSDQARNSFFVIQVFDIFDEDTQSKIHTGYFNGYDFLSRPYSGGLGSSFAMDNISEFLSIYLKNSSIENFTTQVTFYAKFFFYSAQSTKFYPFSYNQVPLKVEDIYIPIVFNLTTYKYNYPTLGVNFYEIKNSNYATLINNTVDSIPIQKSAYPNGNTFTSDGVYLEV